MTHYVQIIEKKTKKVDTQFACDSERDAQRMKSGALINLNHQDYKVAISDTKSDDCEVSK